MTFLALTPLQVLLLCSATAAAVIGLFFLKLRHPRVAVASLLLWRRVLEDKQHRSLMERLRRLLSLMLALAIALLIAAAIGRPESGTLTGEPRQVVLVLDTSVSMAARTEDGQTRWAHARAAARQAIESAGATDRFLVADTSGRITTPVTSDRAALLTALEEMAPSAMPSTFPQVDTSIREVVFVTDGVAALDLPSGTEVLSVFEPADNVAITDFEVRPNRSDPSAYDAHLKIANYAGRSKQVELVVESRSRSVVHEVLEVGVGDVVMGVFPLTDTPSGEVRAMIRSAADALAVDDLAVDYLPPPHNVRALLVTTGNEYLETLLGLDPRVELRVVEPEGFREDASVDVYVFDRFAPAADPGRPALLFRPPGRAWLAGSDRAPARLASSPRVTRWDAAHPVLQFVPATDLLIGQARHFELADDPQIQVVAAANQTPLIVAASGSPKWVMVTFDLDNSDLAVRPGFPIFMQNVLTWFVGEPRALKRSVGGITVPLGQARITTSDGREVRSQAQPDGTRFEAFEPGLFVASAGAARVHVAVNLAGRGTSDLNRSTLGEVTPVRTPGRRWFHLELWMYMLALAIALATLEWWTYHRRITV